MKIVYYFNEKRIEKEKSIVKAIYGDEITFIDRKPWLESAIFNQGDILICNSVDELTDVDDISENADLLISEYLNLYNKGVELVFDKSTQCNSLFIKTLITGENDFESVLKKCILNYANQKNLEGKYSRKHVLTAEINGNKVGIKKGTKLTTKKSVEMKSKISELSKDFSGEYSDEDLISMLGISRNTFYKYKKELRNGDL